MQRSLTNLLTPFPAVPGGTLHWRQPKALRQEYELRTEGGELLATLSMKMGWMRARTEATTSAGNWTFQHVGFLHPRVLLRKTPMEEQVAEFQLKKLGKGTVRFADGHEYEWKTTSFWKAQFGFFDSSGNAVLSIRRDTSSRKLSDLFKANALIELPSAATPAEQLSVLALFAWYFLILRRQQGAAVAAVH